MGTLAALAVVAAACGDDSSEDATEDAAAEDAGAGEGDDHSDHSEHDDAELVDVDRDDRCDIGFNTAAFNGDAEPRAPHDHSDDGSGVDFTVEEWAEVFVQPENPMSSGIPRDVVVDYINAEPGLRNGVLSGSIAHELQPDPWLPMTDHEECTALADELAITQGVAAAHPTAQDAIDAGYTRVVPYYPGIGAHYMNFDLLDDEFDIAQPEMLLYDASGPEANMIGVSHFVQTENGEPPEEGFTGPNDYWHEHVQLCFSAAGEVIGGSNVSDEECEDQGGTLVSLGSGWMNHVWIVPGCESDWGLFSAASPALVERGLDAEEPAAPGCGTDTPLDGDLNFDEGGHGPTL